jgi:hypothetical protein
MVVGRPARDADGVSHGRTILCIVARRGWGAGSRRGGRGGLTREVIVAPGGIDEARDMTRILLLFTTLGFGAFTALALWHHGYLGLFQPALESLAAAQVLIDLVIALVLFLVWMWGDAKRLGRNPWPWAALTLAAGSFGPLLYLLTRPTDAPPDR